MLAAIAAVSLLLTAADRSAGAAEPATAHPSFAVVIRAAAPPRYLQLPVGSVCGPVVDPAPSGVSESDFLRAARGADASRIVLLLEGYATSLRRGGATARRVALALGAQDLVVTVDWGSSGHRAGYLRDRRAAKRNAAALAQFIARLRDDVGSKEIDVFAYSLGALAALDALSGSDATAPPAVDRVVLGAPDVALAEYQGLLRKNRLRAQHLTVYVSGHDRALLLSSLLTLRSRLGRALAWRSAMTRTDVVDAGRARHGVTGHDYAVEDWALLGDMAATLHGAAAPHADWMPSQQYASVWSYVPQRAPASTPPCSSRHPVGAEGSGR